MYSLYRTSILNKSIRLRSFPDRRMQKRALSELYSMVKTYFKCTAARDTSTTTNLKINCGTEDCAKVVHANKSRKRYLADVAKKLLI